MTRGFPDWTRAVLLTGQDSEGNFVTVQVEPGGQLWMLMKGLDLTTGEIETVGLDDKGRISAFVIDSSDAWGQILAVGNAELAARQGSPVSFDRRGQVIEVQNFANGWGIWSGGGVGALNAYALDPTRSVSGGYSVKLTSGQGEDGAAVVGGIVPTLPDTVAGLAARVSINAEAKYIVVEMHYHDGAYYHRVQWRWDVELGKLEVYDEDGNWQTVETDLQFYHNPALFNYIKLVADFDRDYYVRGLFNSIEKDLSAYPVWKEESGLGEALTCKVWVCSLDGYNDIVYVDSVVVTVNEPV